MCKNCIYANEYGDCTSTGSECIQEEARREERDMQEGSTAARFEAGKAYTTHTGKSVYACTHRTACYVHLINKWETAPVRYRILTNADGEYANVASGLWVEAHREAAAR